MEPFSFDGILDFISSEKCTLVVGPEMMYFEGKPMNMFLRDRIYEQFKDKIKHYYATDGFFLFQNSEGKSDAAQALKIECSKLPTLEGYNEDLLKSIAQLPFHLIISINPDSLLSRAFTAFGVKHHFSFYRKGGAPSDQVPRPTREMPLIYNIAGWVEEDESLILDYDDLFTLISSSLGAAGLPGELRTALDKTRSYIFIGFPFEKWYTQLMLRIICGKIHYPKYTQAEVSSSDTGVFLMNEFNVKFWDAKNGNFWTEFTQKAAQYKEQDPQKVNLPFLRELLDESKTPASSKIKILVKNGELRQAIDLLIAITRNTEFENLAIQLSTRLNHLEQTKAETSHENFTLEFNKIASDILALINLIFPSK